MQLISIILILDSKDTFDNLDIWIRELRTYSSPDSKIFLIGNKLDLEDK